MAATSKAKRAKRQAAGPRVPVVALPAPGTYPQRGFQERALLTPADIAIIGGAAGGGKSFVLLMEASRYQYNRNFAAVFFRRTYPQIMNVGGLWDTASGLYPTVGAVPKLSEMQWVFRSGARVMFRHLQHEDDVYQFQGSQIPAIFFDELTHFTEKQFTYMLSRNRSTCGVRPYVRASCNPDPNSWVAKWVEWWIDQDEKLPSGEPNPRYGLPIPERAGQLRYFTRDNNELIWGNTPEEVKAKVPHLYVGELANVDPKSFTFIPGTIYENPALLSKDPGYLGNLMAQDKEERDRLLNGNWKISSDGLGLFEPQALADLFTNYPADADRTRYLTCDAARFGRDFCVIFVWEGWKVLAIRVLTRTDNNDIRTAIEGLRLKYNVSKSNTLIDQDGVGGGVVALGGYQGFSGGATALPDPVTRKPEAYANLKTQCYYRLADRVNERQVRVEAADDVVQVDGQWGAKLKVGGKVTTVRELLRDDLRTVRRLKPDAEGKKHIVDKATQKAVLGRSPDFGDTAMMRVWFELKRTTTWAPQRMN